jgi:archaemetzincin
VTTFSAIFLGLIAAVITSGETLWCGAGEPAYTKEDAERLKKLDAAIAKLKPLHKKLGKPKPGDWLHRHKEKGQTFNQYLVSRPVMPQGKRKVIYIQPLGEFKGKQREIVKLSAEFMGIYFNVPVKVRKDLPLKTVPAEARRRHPQWGMNQILAGHVLDKVLKPRLPEDAAAYIAFTTSDLWPGRGWNFVFGMASLRERVGVWSIYRNGDPAGGDKAFRLCLLRTIKTATHETGHMFSMLHCTAYECNMCGSNHREESDRRPVFCCPECVAKIAWACRADLVERYRKLGAFFKKQGFETQEQFCRKSIRALGGDPDAKSEQAEAPKSKAGRDVKEGD